MTGNAAVDAEALAEWEKLLASCDEPEVLALARQMFALPWVRRLFPLMSHRRLVLSANPPLASLRREPSVAVTRLRADNAVAYFVTGIVEPEKRATFGPDDSQALEASVRSWLMPAWRNRVAGEVWRLAADGAPIGDVLLRFAAETQGVFALVVAMQVFDVSLVEAKNLSGTWQECAASGAGIERFAAEHGDWLMQRLRATPAEWTDEYVNGGWRGYRR